MADLEAVYTDPSSTGAYGGVSKLIKAAKGTTIKAAQDYLKSNISYTLTKARQYNFKRSKTYVHSIGELWQIDLSDMKLYAKENDGIKWLLFVIDCFSRKLQVVPLLNKSGPSLHAAFVSLLADESNRPLKIQADRGSKAYSFCLNLIFKIQCSNFIFSRIL